ncbi:hypothetical protein MMC08_001648 [Hypocenomyce scalaris]|nr:hypothetical protein [Hypocenomyce scalaris]
MNLDIAVTDIADSRSWTQLKQFADELLADSVYTDYERDKKKQKTSKNTKFKEKDKDKKTVKGKDKKLTHRETTDVSDLSNEKKKFSYQSEFSINSNDDDDDDYADTMRSSSDEDNTSDASDITEEEEDVMMSSIILKSRITAALQRDFMQLTASQQEAFNQNEMNLHQLLSLAPDQIYALTDLENCNVLNCVLHLLYRTHFEQANQNIQISLHINYDKLPAAVSAAIKVKLHLEEAEVQRCIDALNTHISKSM